MIQIINSIDEIETFARSFQNDLTFSDPMMSDEGQFQCNLVKSIREPERYRTIGIYDGDQLTGLFSFLVPPQEKYLEMIVGLSRETEAYQEMMDYIKQSFPSYQADFVYNPRNPHMNALMERTGALVDATEYLRMDLTKIVPVTSTHTIVPYSEAYWDGYQRIHDDSDGRYWTAEKTVASLDRFRIFLALHGNQVVGYIDITHCFDENEPFDLFVCQEYRNRGYGRALLAKAIEANVPNKLMLTVEVTNAPAIHLYESMGFVVAPNGGNKTARMQL